MSEFSMLVYRYVPTYGYGYRFIKNWSQNVKDIVFGTKNPGGFSECSFRYEDRYDVIIDIYSNYHHNWVEIVGGGGETAWFGRIESIMAEPGQATITCYGLWAHTFDQIYNDGSFFQDTIGENPVTYRNNWAPLLDTYDKIAQSFVPSEERALQDIQIRLRRYSTGDQTPGGSINFELRSGSQDGTLITSSTIVASDISDTTDGFSEYVALVTDARLDDATTYYVVIYGDSTYISERNGSNYIAVGWDTVGHYADGSATYWNGAIWQSMGGDIIFYVWPHPKWYCTDAFTAGDIVADMVSELPLIDSGTYYITDDGQVSTPIRFTSDEKYGDAISKLITYGSSDATPVPLFCGFYEGNAIRMRKFTEGRTWHVDGLCLPEGEQALNITSALSGFRTRTAVLYSSSVGKREVTTWAVNQDLYDKFGYHRDGLFSISGATEDTADAIATMVADLYVSPEQKLNILIEGVVKTRHGKKVPAWNVRAGDTIEVRNIIPSGAMMSAEMADRLDTFYVQETSYDVDTGRLNIVTSTQSQDLIDIILAIAGLSGGSLK